MRQIKVDEQVWKELQRRGETFTDRPNDVLRQTLGLDPPRRAATRELNQDALASTLVIMEVGEEKIFLKGDEGLANLQGRIAAAAHWMRPKKFKTSRVKNPGRVTVERTE